MTALFILVSILILSLLIFVHELGHYLMARRVGMRVETFSIGFGRPIWKWKQGDTTWQIGWIPFGGFVRIAGSETDSDVDPYTVKDGFFGKPAFDRIKVLLAGPVANLLTALVAFTILWAMGGREKNFSEFTPVIGWVDPKSDLFNKGVRPGDEVLSYNGYAFQGSKDHLYAPMTSNGTLDVAGIHLDEATGEKKPFNLNVATYPHPESLDKGIKTAGILRSANYVIYNTLYGNKPNPLPEKSPLVNSGIQYGDRIFWVDGELIFSSEQLNRLLNDGRSLLTIQRGDQHFLRRVPRVEVQELRLGSAEKEELIDWQFEAQLNSVKTQKLLFIPYNLTNDAVVEGKLRFLDEEMAEIAFPTTLSSDIEAPLEIGDRIVAIDGQPISSSYALLEGLQKHAVLVIVERDPHLTDTVSWQDSTAAFENTLQPAALKKITDSIGTDKQVEVSGNYVLLKPIYPATRGSMLKDTQEAKAWATAEMLSKKKRIEAIEDPEKRQMAMQIMMNEERQLLLGLPAVQDRRVEYNPNPIELFNSVVVEIWRTIKALFTGSLSPKWMSGPVGIIQVVQENASTGIRDALFWIGAISINLGILNLLPIPVLDGGGILIQSYEWITRRRLNLKVVENLTIPFAVLLILLFVFLTFNDVGRLFK